MTTLLQNSLSTTTPIAQECLRLLASFLRTCPDWAPTTVQLQFLITWSLSDVEEAAQQNAAFALLRGVVKRRLVVPEVFDVMSKVEDLMIRSQVSNLSAEIIRHGLQTPLHVYLVLHNPGGF